MLNKAILVASFGTSYEETRQKNIVALENHIKVQYAGYKIYSTYTSGMVRKILASKGIEIFDVETAMQTMHKDGIKEIIVLPTHLLYGIEYDKLCGGVHKFEHLFDKVVITTPLLASTEDMNSVLSAIDADMQMEKDECLVLMGHGTEHFCNPVYAALDYMCKAKGLNHIFIGTVEAYPDIDTVISLVKKTNYKKAVLAPLMLVAGDHAVNDMASDDDDSWKTKFEKNGIQTRTIVKGLGEMQKIKEIYCQHISRKII